MPLDNDYLNIQRNFTQLQNTYSKDHIALTDNSGAVGTPGGKNGAHTLIHQVPFSTIAGFPPNNYPLAGAAIPSVVSGMGEIFTVQQNDGINPDEALYYQTGGGRLMQLTRNFTPIVAQNGSTFLPGGLILQWGFKAITAQGVSTVTYPMAFPANVYNVRATAVYDTTPPTGSVPNGSAVVEIDRNTANFLKTGFSFLFTTNSTAYVGIFWEAIGN